LPATSTAAAQAESTFSIRRASIAHGRPEATNIAFGGDDWKTLYFTNRNYLGSVKVKIAGIPVPVAKKA
jgi:sugar lactone lactonase YvrE